MDVCVRAHVCVRMCTVGLVGPCWPRLGFHSEWNEKHGKFGASLTFSKARSCFHRLGISQCVLVDAGASLGGCRCCPGDRWWRLAGVVRERSGGDKQAEFCLVGKIASGIGLGIACA